MGPPGDAVKQLVQSYRTGVLCVEEAPVPALQPVGVPVRNFRQEGWLATLRVVESLQRCQPVEVNLAALDSQHD